MHKWSGTVVRKTVEYRSTKCEDMPRKPLDIRLRIILFSRKGASAPFSCLPARTGPGRARNRVKGLAPCGFSGQRPEPSESFSESISAIFKVHLSLFFSAQFFIDYLTLPLIVLALFIEYFFNLLLSFINFC